jgi:hypothetical protein
LATLATNASKMKIIPVFLAALLFVSCAKGNEKTYIGSTPAGNMARSFLHIPLSDSVDFIRWKCILRSDSYLLQCNYGIGKPNTNGFINGGKKIELSGVLKKEKNYYELLNGKESLKFAILNEDLLHLLNTDNSFLVGNGGWSYTLTNTAASGSDVVNFNAEQGILKDSMAFQGRTPCGVPGVIAPGTTCYKLKWSIVLYSNAQRNEPGTYKIRGTAWRNEGGITGNWKIITGKNGRIIYQLNDEEGKTLLYLLKVDEHILLFTDAEGKLLTGDEDFSYTLNRKW